MPRIPYSCRDKFFSMSKEDFLDYDDQTDLSKMKPMIECLLANFEVDGIKLTTYVGDNYWDLYWNPDKNPSKEQPIVIDGCGGSIGSYSSNPFASWGGHTMHCRLRIHESLDSKWFKNAKKPDLTGKNLENDPYPLENLPEPVAKIVSNHKNLEITKTYLNPNGEQGRSPSDDYPFKESDQITLGISVKMANKKDITDVKSYADWLDTSVESFEERYLSLMNDLKKNIS